MPNLRNGRRMGTDSKWKFRVRLRTFKVGTMAWRGRELTAIEERRKMEVSCVQGTWWKGNKASVLGKTVSVSGVEQNLMTQTEMWVVIVLTKEILKGWHYHINAVMIARWLYCLNTAMITVTRWQYCLRVAMVTRWHYCISLEMVTGWVHWIVNVSNCKELWIARRKHQHLTTAGKDH